MGHTKMDKEDALIAIGICALGDIPPRLIESLREYMESAPVKFRHHRQTELEWDSICDQTVKCFEEVSG